jgi:hypothetical protein
MLLPFLLDFASHYLVTSELIQCRRSSCGPDYMHGISLFDELVRPRFDFHHRHFAWTNTVCKVSGQSPRHSHRCNTSHSTKWSTLNTLKTYMGLEITLLVCINF